MLTRASEEHDNVLRSAARGGVKVALAMLWAWYPDINMHTATEYMLEADEQGHAIDQRALISSVSGYASRLADMVNIGVFHKAYPDPHAEQGETSAAANPEDVEDEAANSDAEEAEPTNADAGNPDMAPLQTSLLLLDFVIFTCPATTLAEKNRCIKFAKLC